MDSNTNGSRNKIGSYIYIYLYDNLDNNNYKWVSIYIYMGMVQK